MNPPKVNEYDYTNFLIATQKVDSCLEAERVQPESPNAAAHDAITRVVASDGAIKPATVARSTAASNFVPGNISGG